MSEPTPNVPAPRLSSEQIEAVVKRAMELQSQDAESRRSGITHEEMVRIGNELGIDADYIRRALAETRTVPPAKAGFFGPGRVTAARNVPGNADVLRRQIEKYLVDVEYLAVVRRMPDRTVYEKARGLHVEMQYVMEMTGEAIGGRRRRVGAGFALRTGRSFEVSVTPTDETHAWVTFVLDLGNQRTGYWAGMGTSGSVIAALAGLAGTVMIAPPAGLVALPVLAGTVWATRAAYGSVAKRAHLHLEALLDHLEGGEMLPGGTDRDPPQ